MDTSTPLRVQSTTPAVSSGTAVLHDEVLPVHRPTQGPVPGGIIVDTDSSDEDDVSTYTASLISSIRNFPVENGRRYHAFRDGAYLFPNDEDEQARMDIQHEMCMRACDQRLHLAPLDDTNGKRFLDIGTGTGIWCMQMGDRYPEAEVFGNDLSPIQPAMVPQNVKFEVDDIESPWMYPSKFDYIHSRFMAGSIANWPGLINQCYENLRPGGIIELQDGDFVVYSEDGSLKGSWLEKWNHDFASAAQKVGRTVQPGPQLENWVREAGFEDVYHEKVPLPLGIWPKNKKLKDIGAFNLVQLKDGLEGFSLRLFTHALGWAPEELQDLLGKVRKDLGDKTIHAQNDMHIVWARKPRA